MCAIFGIIAKKSNLEIVSLFIKGFSRLQHRGYESAGAIYSNGNYVWTHKDFGTIAQVFTPEAIAEIKKHKPKMIIGQTHYSTSGNKSRRNIPPQWMDTLLGRFGLIHNGNIPNLDNKKIKLEQESNGDVRFEDDAEEVMNDTEFMLRNIVWLSDQNNHNIFESITKFIDSVAGGYSAALISKDSVILFRDSWGNRPLFIAESDDAIFFASETCAFEGFGAGNSWSLGPGYILELKASGNYGNIYAVKKSEPLAHCVFENIYFARPDSHTFTNVSEKIFRFKLGQKLSIWAPVLKADFITYLPNSGQPAAEGYAYQLKKPLIAVYVKDPHIQRTFIHPDPEERKKLAEIKYSLIKELVPGQRIVLIDDTIVRGTTIGTRVRELFEAGALEVHVRISAPPVISPCYYGINMPTKEELIASKKNSKQICEEIGATSLEYLPLQLLHDVIQEAGSSPVNFCDACFTGDYGISLE